jgi:hypothetical protein
LPPGGSSLWLFSLGMGWYSIYQSLYSDGYYTR